MAKKKITPEPEPVEENQWANPATVPAEDPLAGSSEDGRSQEDDWNTAPAPTHNEIFIRTHAGQFDPDQAKVLIYGESGAGKTRLASTWPETLFLDIDKGMGSVTEVVDAIDIDQFSQLEAAYEFLRPMDHGYTTVVLDTLNELQRLAMHATVEDFPAIRRSYDDLPSMSDYGKMLHDMMEITRKFIALPMRVVLLAQVGTRQFETDVLMPQLIGKNTAREIARKMDIIGYIYTSDKEDPKTGKKYKEITFDNSTLVTKDRSFRLPEVLLNPSFDSIYAYLK